MPRDISQAEEKVLASWGAMQLLGCLPSTHNVLGLIPLLFKQGTVMHASNPSTAKLGTGGFRV